MKKLTNSKKLFTITLVFAVFCFMATSSWAAQQLDISKGNASNFIQQLNENQGAVSTSMKSVFGLSDDGGFILVRQRMDFNGETHERYQQTYKGFPVWGMQTIVSKGKNNKVTKLRGNLVLGSKNDINNIPSQLDPLGALREMQDHHRNQNLAANWNFSNEKYGTYVYFRKNGKAALCCVVSYFADDNCGNPSQPIYFINPNNNKVLHSYDALQYADGIGPGGNLKIGYYYYGPGGDYPAFGVTQNGSTCTMNTTDVKTVNLNHGTSGSTAYSYTCFENTHKQINGAYCPLNDAQYFGQVVYDMYQDWYSLPVLPFQLMMRVHYSTNYENAFWNGSSMTFGDGYTTFHPLVCLDVSAHEVAHGFTDNHSDLIYSGQSGGINEAYSDMAGEGAEYYSRGSCDYMCGYDIFKAAGQALRYLYDPPLDGISIDHVDDYYPGMDVHYSSGIFNKAFYLIAVSPGWTPRMAFDIFTKANTDYWTPSTNFQQGAEGAQDAAADYGYSCTAVRDAFAQVGITLVCAGPPVADFSGTPTSGSVPLTVNFTDLSSNDPTSWSWNFGDTGTSTQKNPTHVYTASGSYTVTLTATNSSGSDVETKVNYITVTALQPPVADFTASATTINEGQDVTFTDLSTNNPTSWSWTFAGGTPSSSTAENPTITYNTAGTYTVSLTAANAAGSDTETKTNYITVNEPGTGFCDDFSDGDASDWTPTGGTWTVVGGQLDGIDTSNRRINIAPAGNVGAGTISVDWTSLTGGTWTNGMVVFGYQDAQNYRVVDCRDGANNWYIREFVGGTQSNKAVLSETINTNQQYHVVVDIAESGLVTVTVDGIQKVSYDFGNVITGQVGVALQNSHSQFDNFCVDTGTGINYCDDFSDGDAGDWTYYGGGTWSAAANELDGYHASAYTYAISPAGAVADGTISVDWTSKTGGTWTNGQIVFGWQDANNYCLADCRDGGNKWRLRQCVNGTLSNVATTEETINTNQLYQLELVIGSGGIVTLYVDGVSKVSFDFGSAISGEAGVSVQKARSVFDNFCVTGTAAGQ
jgi:Zn-dependent metalloprotease